MENLQMPAPIKKASARLIVEQPDGSTYELELDRVSITMSIYGPTKVEGTTEHQIVYMPKRPAPRQIIEGIVKLGPLTYKVAGNLTDHE